MQTTNSESDKSLFKNNPISDIPETAEPKKVEDYFENWYKKHSAVVMLAYFNIGDKPLENQLKEYLAKKLEAEISVELQAQMKKTTRRFILFVGDDINLMEALGSYFYCIKGETPFYFYSLCGRTENEVEAILNESERHFYNGDNKLKKGDLAERLRQNCSIFLGGMECKSEPFLMRMIERIIRVDTKGIEKRWCSGNSPKGLLVISTLTPLDEIYKPFERLFKVIDLEPEKKKEAVETTPNTPERQKTSISEAEQGVMALFYDDAKGILFLEDGKKCELTGDEQTLFDYLKKGEQHVEDIIHHFCNKKEYLNTNWNRGNFDNLTSDLNKKSHSAFGVRLIKNLEKGSGKYGISVKVKDKKFKK
ncbi:MAG: hypothetical protein NUV74_02450 [Candidatus Brocadiaceae bacterium]|nr:hypothetical protein [Candidatus Brocadiaceae bacterium]